MRYRTYRGHATAESDNGVTVKYFALPYLLVFWGTFHLNITLPILILNLIGCYKKNYTTNTIGQPRIVTFCILYNIVYGENTNYNNNYDINIFILGFKIIEAQTRVPSFPPPGCRVPQIPPH